MKNLRLIPTLHTLIRSGIHFVLVAAAVSISGCTTTPGITPTTCNPACATDEICNQTTGTCTPATMQSLDAGSPADMIATCIPACSGLTPICNDKQVCVACLTDSNCAIGQMCGTVAGVPACVSGCATDARCGGVTGTAGPACCGMSCTNTLTDATNCGACGTPCAPAHAAGNCAAGACTMGACDEGWGDCDQMAADGCEANLHIDVNNCGACNIKCAFANGIAGCSDSCYIAACNFGYDDCDGDATNGCEVSTLSDPKNCGGCGATCAAVPNGKAGCSVGACLLQSCNQGYADCDGKIVNGCEVNVATDKNNCGACGAACLANQVCSNGGCTCANCNLPNAKTACVNNVCMLASCLPGYADCNAIAADGCEVNIAGDKNNCSACGMRCAMGMSCVNSACAVCNNAVLVLGDDQAAADMNLVADLNKAGMTATLVANGSINYAGVPAATNFGAVITSIGNNYSTDMPAAGQQALVQAQAAGIGMVWSEWAAYQVMSGRWQTLKPLLLFSRTSGTTSTLTYTSQVAHPIWTGLPNSFVTVNSMGANVGAGLLNGGTQIAGCTECMGSGVVVKDDGTGRIVQMSFASNYTSGGQGQLAWTNDTNLTLLMTNAANWATRCK